MSKRLSFGLWYSWRNPAQWAIPLPELYEATLQQIEWAENNGYDDVWLTEHHFAGDGHSPSILTMAAAVAARTKRIRIGTGILILPLHNAVRVAEDGATIDILSNGRFELGVGVGYKPDEFDNLGYPMSERASRMNEGLEVIRALWSGEAVHYQGKHYQLDGAVLDPLPVQKPRPKIWVGGFAPISAKRAARLGDGFIGTAEMTELARIYGEERQRLGLEGPGHLAGGHFWLVVSKTPEKTFDEIAPHVLYQLQVYNRWLTDAGQTLFPDIPDVTTLKQLGVLQVLTPAEAVDAIGGYVEATGIERWYTWTVPPGYPVEKMNEHLALMASEVMPHFQ